MPPQDWRPTVRLGIDDVARAAGVSRVTVSRAMNSPGLVTEATRAKIDRAMRELGYVPNLMARGLAQSRSKIVACFVPTLVSSIFADTIQGLTDRMREAGYSVMVGTTEYSAEQEDRVVEAALGRRPDGLVLTGLARSAQLRRVLLQAGVPAVETWNLTRHPIDMVVGFSNFEAARSMGRHLISRGYRRIAYAGRPAGDNDRAAARLKGYRAALAEAGLEPDPALVFGVETTLEAGASAVRKIRALVPGVQAVMFSTDSLAAGAWLACLAEGWRVPDDIAIAGFGDIDIALSIPGGLTTINVRGYEIGRLAGELLVSRWRGDPEARRQIDVGYELMARGST